MNGSNFGRIPALLIWSNMWKRSSRILAKNIKLILYRHLRTHRVFIHISDSNDIAGFPDGETGSPGHRERYCENRGDHWTPVLVYVAPDGLATRHLHLTTGVRTLSRGGDCLSARPATPGVLSLQTCLNTRCRVPITPEKQAAAVSSADCGGTGNPGS